MRFILAGRDVERMRALVAAHQNDPFLRNRRIRNVDGLAPRFDREQFWFVLLGSLITTRQRSTHGSPVNRFLSLTPFPLSLTQCGNRVETAVRETLTTFHGIRMAPTISKRASLNHKWLFDGGWTKVQTHFARLARQRNREPLCEDKMAERDAARTISSELFGFGPKQSRNLWQWLGLTRYEIPLDSRVVKWINQNLSVVVDTKKLANATYYDEVLDFISTLCEHAGILPCVFDAAAFDYGEKSNIKAAEAIAQPTERHNESLAT